MDLMATKISLRQLRRNLSRLKKRPKTNGNLTKVAKIERKIASRIAELAECGATEKDVLFKSKKEKQKSNFGGYKKYIDSPEWSERRRVYYLNHEKRCRSCGAKDKEIHLHHRTYKRLGREDDSDLMPLCNSCHSILHFFQRSLRLTVEVATEFWIDSTNSCKEKKKIREVLRCISLKKFKSTWKILPDKQVEPSVILSSIFKILLEPKKETTTKEAVPHSLKREALISKRTGDTRRYDRSVDRLIRRLEKR